MNISPRAISSGMLGLFRSQKPDLNATISRSRYDIVSATIEVKIRAVGGATLGEDYTTPFIVIDGSGSVTVVADRSAAAPFFVYKQKEERNLKVPSVLMERRPTPSVLRLMTGRPSGGIVRGSVRWLGCPYAN